MPTAAVIGCGDVSIVHLEAIQAHPAAELIAVCDADSVTAAAAGQRWGVPTFDDHRALIAAVRPDVVHICTPHDQHARIVIDCLEAGVAVITEKPLAATVAEGKTIVAAAEANPQVKIGVCFQNRYNVAVQAIRSRLESGGLGTVLGGHGTVFWHRTPAYYAARPWRGERRHSGGGVLINQAIHTLDLLQWLLGDVTSVDGHIGRYRLGPGLDVEDTAALLLEHGGGARSVLFATNAGVVDAPVTLEIHTEGATLFLRGDLTVSRPDGEIEVISERHAQSGGRAYWGVSHQLLIADFYARLDDPEPFWIGPAEAMKSLRIIEQAYALAPR